MSEYHGRVDVTPHGLSALLLPAMREMAYRMGRFALDLYLSMPWYRRVWLDFRSGRFVANLRYALGTYVR